MQNDLNKKWRHGDDAQTPMAHFTKDDGAWFLAVSSIWGSKPGDKVILASRKKTPRIMALGDYAGNTKISDSSRIEYLDLFMVGTLK